MLVRQIGPLESWAPKVTNTVAHQCKAQFTTKCGERPNLPGTDLPKKWHTRPQKVQGPIYHQIRMRPNLPGPDLPTKNGTLGPKKYKAHFTTKLAMGPICRGLICWGPIQNHLKSGLGLQSPGYFLLTCLPIYLLIGEASGVNFVVVNIGFALLQTKTNQDLETNKHQIRI